LTAPDVVLNLWTVYERPSDYTQGFVARLHHAYANGTHGPTSLACYGPSLESVRAQLPGGLYNLGRQPDDDPCIVETWI
jgi:hypothetical protein